MKKVISIVLLTGLLLCVQGCITSGGYGNRGYGNSLNQPAQVEKPLVTCAPSGARPTLAVMPFKIAAGYRARRAAGDGLSDMLLSALVETQCFRVVERSRMEDIMREQGMGLGGTIDDRTAARVGGLAGAQLLVMGTITEFKENASGGLGGFGLPRIASIFGMTSAHIGFIVRIGDSTTVDILISKCVNKHVKKVGIAPEVVRYLVL
jgi:curli biogenesis system outer membrane secretion channel CsgG